MSSDPFDMNVSVYNRRKSQSRCKSDVAAWPCGFCSKQFHRSDVLRRHYQSCPQRGQRQIPHRLRRGRRKQACDSCARLKTSCDLDSPCEKCLLSGNTCSYLRTEAKKHQMKSTKDRAGLPPITAPVLTQEETGNHKISIPFLLNWANPHRGLTNTFERSRDVIVDATSIPVDFESGILGPVEASADMSELCSFPQSDSGYQEEWLPCFAMSDDLALDITLHTDADMLFPSIYDLGVANKFSPTMFLPFQETQHSTRSILSTSQADTETPATWDLMGRDLSAEFAESLTKMTLTLPRDHAEHAPSINLALGMTMLTQANIEKFLWLYFHHWNRHSPVVHRRSFEVTDSSLALLLVMTLTGALFSLSPEEVATAQSMLDLAEEFAFRDPDFDRIASGIFPEGTCGRRRALQALQASFSAAQLQLREGSTWKRHIVRSVRFNQIIYALRTMSLQNLRAHSGDDSSDGEELLASRAWAERESSLRLLYGIFNLDVAFTIFYDATPRLFFHEIQMHQPCSQDAYMAESFEACRDILLGESETSCPPFPQTVRSFAKNDGVTVSAMGNLNLMYLFSVLFGLLQIIKSTRRKGDSTERISYGLRLWKAKWDEAVRQMTPVQQQTSGFIKSAGPEFWHLACYLASTTTSKDDADSVRYSVFKELLESAKDLGE